jgi:uncharacterized protein YdiU (UPF0061 family)
VAKGLLLVIGLLIFAGMTAEGVMYDWSVLYLNQEVGMSQSMAALGYAIFPGAMALSRFGGDTLRSRHSERALLRFGASLAAIAMTIVLVSANRWVALIGFAVAGAGLAPVAPILFNAATRVPGVSRAAAIASVTSIGYSGFMIGPPLIGGIATATSLTMALGARGAGGRVSRLGRSPRTRRKDRVDDGHARQPAPQWPAFAFDNSYARELKGFYVARRPDVVREAEAVVLQRPAGRRAWSRPEVPRCAREAAMFAGNTVPEGAEPLAQAYAGHQFGGFSPQLGDGRALLLGEVIDRQGRRRDIAFKGSGRTPFARGGDGKAAVGPMLREVLSARRCTRWASRRRARSPSPRRARTSIANRSARRGPDTRGGEPHPRRHVSVLRRARRHGQPAQAGRVHDRAARSRARDTHPQRYLALLRNVAERQAALIAQWMNVGFIHGVMNTDNMTLSGETIDYGRARSWRPTIPPRCSARSTTRALRLRQPAQHRGWNLARLAETLLPLLSDDSEQAVAMATEVLAAFPAQYRKHLLRGLRAKLGCCVDAKRTGRRQRRCRAGRRLVELLHAERVDFTLGWRRLADAARRRSATARAVRRCARARCWLARWRARCAR